MTHRRTRAFLLALVATLAIAGCAPGPAAPAQPAGVDVATGTADPGPTGASNVAEALRFGGPTVAGGTFDGASLAGKPAVLWFWAAWCPRCQAKAAEVGAAQTATSGKVNFVGVAGLGSGQEAMARFVAQHSLGGFPHLADDTGTVWRHFGVVEQEYFVLIDATGTIVHKGPLSTADLDRRVADLAG
jgi:peroxiredoxin